jgi:hypothetical protein
VPFAWPDLSYEQWHETCDTLHAHTQLLGKLAVALAPPEPQLQHAALRLTARGWETAPLPRAGRLGHARHRDRSPYNHEVVVETSNGGVRRVALVPIARSAWSPARFSTPSGDLSAPSRSTLNPQEVPWGVPLDEDDEHTRYDPDQVASYFAAATQAALVLAEFRAPYRGRSTPVNAWWGSFDLAVNLFSGLPAAPPSDDFIMRNAMDAQEVASAGGRAIGNTASGVLCLRAPGAGRVCGGDALPGGGPLECDTRRVHPRLGRRLRQSRPARRRESNLPGLRSVMLASCAIGIRHYPPVSRAGHRLLSEASPPNVRPQTSRQARAVLRCWWATTSRSDQAKRILNVVNHTD